MIASIDGEHTQLQNEPAVKMGAVCAKKMRRIAMGENPRSI